MKLNAPKKGTYCIAVLVLILGIIFKFLPQTAGISFWVVTASAVIFALACFVKGL